MCHILVLFCSSNFCSPRMIKLKLSLCIAMNGNAGVNVQLHCLLIINTYTHIYLPIYLIYLSILSILSIYLIYLSILSIYSIYLIYLSIFLCHMFQLPSSSLVTALHTVHHQYVLCSLMWTLIYIQWVTFICKCYNYSYTFLQEILKIF